MRLHRGWSRLAAGGADEGAAPFNFTELPSLFRGESSRRGEKIPAATLFQSSSLYERALPKAGPEHTVSTEKREREKEKRESRTNRHSTTAAPHGSLFGKKTHIAPHSDDGEDESCDRVDRKTGVSAKRLNGRKRTDEFKRRAWMRDRQKQRIKARN